MPEFHVLFNGRVIDQPDHPKRQVVIDPGVPFRVSAPDATAAAFHAARVTRGEGVPVAAYDDSGSLVWGAGADHLDLQPPAPPLVELPQGEVTEVFGA